MGFGKWFLVLAAGGVGAGVVVAGMTTGRMQKYPEGYALSGEAHQPSRRDRAYAAEEEQGYALSDGDYTGSDHSGFGPPRGRMVVLGNPGWVDDGYAAPAPGWSDDDDGGDDSPPFIAAPPRALPGQQGYMPPQAAPRNSAAASPSPSGRDSAAESAARAAGAAADVLAAEREGA
ncbi:MAG: hypothetical protein J7530_12760 [Novosphingobium sp.]|nr:hypothetical protein [Novosphingobium sp.]